jgi:hypothetical protein
MGTAQKAPLVNGEEEKVINCSKVMLGVTRRDHKQTLHAGLKLFNQTVWSRREPRIRNVSHLYAKNGHKE